MDSASPIAARIAEREQASSGARFPFAMFFTLKLADDGNRTDRRRAAPRDRLPHHPAATGHGRAS